VDRDPAVEGCRKGPAAGAAGTAIAKLLRLRALRIPAGANAPALPCVCRAPAPPPAGACLSGPGGVRGSCVGRPARAGRKVLPHSTSLRCHGRGHRPCPSAAPPLGQPGAKAPGQRPTRPRPAPDPPPAGASLPPGRALASVPPGPAGPQGTVARGRGNAGRVSCPARGWARRSCHNPPAPAAMAKAIAFATALRCEHARRGPKPPASARPAHGGRFAPAGPGAGLSVFPDLPVHRAPSRAGGGNAGRVSRFRPEWRSCALRDARSLWQGPSPLPQRHAGPCPAGGQSPRPAPDPPPAGASPPPGRALASVPPGPAGPQGTVPRRRGKRGSRFLPRPWMGQKVLQRFPPRPHWHPFSPDQQGFPARQARDRRFQHLVRGRVRRRRPARNPVRRGPPSKGNARPCASGTAGAGADSGP